MSSLLRRFLSPPRTPVRAHRREVVEVTLPDGSITPLLRVRDPRARQLKLFVTDRGARLTLPSRASLREAEVFLATQLDWLASQLAQRAALAPAPLFDVGTDGPLPLRGESLPLTWHTGRALRIARDDAGIRITCSERSSAAAMRRTLKEFYLTEARRDIGRWLPAQLPSLPRAPREIRVRPLQSLWGSLSPSDGLSLDLALVLGPPAAFEYVLVHELCHLIQPDHSRRFWREVDRRCPDWRAHRAWFRAEGLLLKQELRRLTGK